jgi:hypothetical protein
MNDNMNFRPNCCQIKTSASAVSPSNTSSGSSYSVTK